MKKEIIGQSGDDNENFIDLNRPLLIVEDIMVYGFPDTALKNRLCGFTLNTTEFTVPGLRVD